MKNSLSMVMNTVLAMISLLLIFSCSEDENSFENEQLIENNLTKQFTIDNVQLSDIPEIKDYIQTIIDARNILNENIVKCQRNFFCYL